MSKVPFLNTYVDNLTMQETIERIEELIAAPNSSYVIPINVDVVMKIELDAGLRDIVNAADLVLTDGKPLIWISRWYHRPIREKVSGSDLIPRLCKCAEEKGYSVFLLGGEKHVAAAAREHLQKRFPTLQIKGVYSPPMGFDEDNAELFHIDWVISEVKPDILIVCFGCPKQEKWVASHYRMCGAKVSICAGATVDFLAGSVKRAPKWMSDFGLEWLYRFCQEPKRLFKRYFVDDMKILRLIKKYK